MGRRGKVNRPFLSFTYEGEECFVKIRKPKIHSKHNAESRPRRTPEVAQTEQLHRDLTVEDIQSIGEFEAAFQFTSGDLLSSE